MVTASIELEQTAKGYILVVITTEQERINIPVNLAKKVELVEAGVDIFIPD